jgi:hypothetical protein
MQAVLKTNKSSDRRAVDDGTFALFKQEFHVACRAKSFQVYGNGFIPFSSVQSAVGAESPSIPALLKA